MKFNIGDIVVGNSKAEVYSVTGPGWIGTVTGIGISYIKVTGPDWNGRKTEFIVLPDCFDLAFQEPSSEEFMSALLAP